MLLRAKTEKNHKILKSIQAEAEGWLKIVKIRGDNGEPVYYVRQITASYEQWEQVKNELERKLADTENEVSGV